MSRIAILKPYEKKEGDDSAATPGDPPDVERPLVLLHGADPLATTACQSIGRQLSAIGIPVELKRLDNSGGPLPEHDLYYCELSMGEPLNDVRRLLGPQGLAGRCTPAMSVALDQLDRIESWNAAREKLSDIHELAHNDLPVVPLWQTVNHFAYRKSLTGVGRSPVSLYQNVDAWRLSAEGGAR